jgi:hypothetical protein
MFEHYVIDGGFNVHNLIEGGMVPIRMHQLQPALPGLYEVALVMCKYLELPGQNVKSRLVKDKRRSIHNDLQRSQPLLTVNDVAGGEPPD